MNAPAIVDVSDLTVTIGDRLILDQLTFTISAGSFTGLIGPNGGGKSTLLKVLVGLLEPTAGSVLLFGHPPGHSHHLIGYVPQATRFNRSFPITVREVVGTGTVGRIGFGRKMGKNDVEMVEKAMEHADISHIAEKSFHSLSGGQRQKVLIGRALALEPLLLLLDEPTTGVDVPSQDHFYQLLQSFQENLGITILMVSHDIGVVTHQVDSILCLNQRLFCHANPESAVSDALIGEAYGEKMELLMHSHTVPHRTVHKH